MRVLEIGCCDGHNLNFINKNTDCYAYGIDLSKETFSKGKKLYPQYTLIEKMNYMLNNKDIVAKPCDRIASVVLYKNNNYGYYSESEKG